MEYPTLIRAILLSTLALWLAAPGPASAHRLTVFAWVEGETVHVESRFGSGRPVQGGAVTVADPDGTTLLTGETDDAGTFAFPAPQRSDLIIAVDAGMGHRGEWRVREAELGAAPGPEKPPEPSTGAAPPAEEKTAEAPSTDPAPPAIPPEALQAAVERALEARLAKQLEAQMDRLDRTLDRKLAPVIRMAAAGESRGPSATEIFGGIGYIFGLAGVAAYVHSRRGGRGTEPS